jgi:hypothetical protein
MGGSGMSTKHATAGPWRILGFAGEHEEAGAVIVGANGERVAHTSGAHSMRPEDHLRDQANARLIAAAPNLLIACKLGQAVAQDTVDLLTQTVGAGIDEQLEAGFASDLEEAKSRLYTFDHALEGQ